MTQDHVKKFEKARDQLLAQRRSLAETLAGGYKKGQTENHIERIVNVQAALDVIAGPGSPYPCPRRRRTAPSRRGAPGASSAASVRRWLTDGCFGKRPPTVNLSHVDLAGSEQRPKQHRGCLS
jgi:hypothetical protein